MMFRVVFWDVLPCKIIVDRRFRGAYCPHHPAKTLSGDNYFTRQYLPEDNSEHLNLLLNDILKRATANSFRIILLLPRVTLLYLTRRYVTSGCDSDVRYSCILEHCDVFTDNCDRSVLSTYWHRGFHRNR
jgi:hypothetical protein